MADHSAESSPPTPAKQNTLSHFNDEVDVAHGDIPVVACCFVSGLCDSVAFNAAGVFVSMQTGNTLFLAIGAAYLPDHQPRLWLKALVSLLFFWLGCFAFGQVTRLLSPRKKRTVVLTFAVQALCILVAAALAQSNVVPAFNGSRLEGNNSGNQSQSQAQEGAASENMRALLCLGFLAFQFGGQIVASRGLGFNEVPTNVLTSVYCDLFSDPGLLAWPLGKNVKRNRRFMAVVLLICGAISGGWLQRSAGGMGAALWIAGGIKAGITLAWVGWKVKVHQSEKNGV